MDLVLELKLEFTNELLFRNKSKFVVFCAEKKCMCIWLELGIYMCSF